VVSEVWSPTSKIYSVYNIVPLVKDKCGDLSDVENYTAITISNAITKVFEFVLFDKLVSSSC